MYLVQIFNTWSLYSLRCEDFTEEVFKTGEKWPPELKGQRRDSPVGGGGSSALWVEALTSQPEAFKGVLSKDGESPL